MKNPIKESLIRNKRKFIFYLAAVTLSIFIFFSTSVQLIIIKDVVNRLGEHYNSIGYLSPTDENKWEISEGRRCV